MPSPGGQVEAAPDSLAPSAGQGAAKPLLFRSLTTWSSGERRAWLWGRRWALSLGGILALAILFLAFFQPLRPRGIFPAQAGVEGRPFYALHVLRQGLIDHYTGLGWLIGLAGGAVTLALLAAGLTGKEGERNRRTRELSLLAAAVTTAALGQWAFGRQPLIYKQPRLIPGLILYALAVLGFAAWAWLARRRLAGVLQPKPPTARNGFIYRWDWLLFLAIFFLAAFTRLWAFPQLPYGVEGDEKNWISGVILLMVDGRSDPSGNFHFSSVPASFFMQAPFQHLFEAGIPAARLAVIVFSLLGSLAFFWLLAQVAPLPLAFLASFLLAVSIADISGSRLANVESHVKLWPILALALLAYALKRDRWWGYLLAGAALAIGMLTYETVWPVAPVVAVLLVVELRRRNAGLKAMLLRGALLFVPVLPTLPIIWKYFAGRLSYYDIGYKWSQGVSDLLLPRLFAYLGTWFSYTWGDFIYSRPTGPMLNAALNPWLVLGLVIALFTLRRSYSLWMLLWAGFVLVPVPIVTNSPVARVYYPGLPAAYALAALGLFFFFAELDGVLFSGSPGILRKGLRAAWLFLGFAGLALLGGFNLYIYFNEVSDPDNRGVIREVGEFIHQGTAPGVHWLIPYLLGANSQLYAEDRTVEIYMHGKIPPAAIPAAYTRIQFDDFLPSLAATLDTGTPVEILLDKNTPQQMEPRQVAAGVLERCFPSRRVFPGRYMDRYSLSPADLEQAACLPIQVDIHGPETDSAHPSLSWSLSAGAASQTRLVCQQGRPDVVWKEAESLEGMGGWVLDNLMIPGWLGEGFMYDNYGYGDIPMEVEVELPGDHSAYAWVRFYKRQVDRSPGMVQLGGQALPFADVPKEHLSQWIWERAGPFQNPSGGKAVWSIARPFAEDPTTFVSLFVDTVIFTTDPGFDPQAVSPWEPFLDQAISFETAESRGKIALDSLTHGRYRCQLGVESPSNLVDAHGQTPVWSDWMDIDIP